VNYKNKTIIGISLSLGTTLPYVYKTKKWPLLTWFFPIYRKLCCTY